MPDLLDGQTAEVMGSGAKPYQLKNVGGVYSCSCPAWRNQSLPIDLRSCKHLREFRGTHAESARLGAPVSTTSGSAKPSVVAPPLLLAETWSEDINPTGWFLSEKLDGVRAFWDGVRFVSRNGNEFFAPEWFKQGLPEKPLDGELWIGRKQFQRTVSIVRRLNAGDLWNGVRFLIFDAPALTFHFEQRMQALSQLVETNKPRYAQVVEQTLCHGRSHLNDELKRVESLGGEGLMLRRPGSFYLPCRSDTLLKVKSFLDCEATIMAHEPGRGRHKGRLGALVVRLANGSVCSVGTGLTDAQRDQPPPIGAIITLKYQELTDAGIPRFPVFVGIRSDFEPTTPFSTAGDSLMSAKSHVSAKRRFVCTEGISNKFWEVSIDGTNVLVTFGRIGTDGQTNRKQLPSDADAQQHGEKLVKQKLAKGYIETV